MLRILIFTAAIAPPLLVLGYGVGKARGSGRSEAMWHAFVVGAVGGIVAAGIEFVLDRWLATLQLGAGASVGTSAILVAAIPEEAIKLFVLVAMAEGHVDARRMQDLLLLALAVSLGFATLENFLYVASFGDWHTIASLRAITAVPGHGIDGLAMGALLMSARMRGIEDWRRLWPVLAVPVILHAAYDLPLFAIESGLNRTLWAAVWLGVIVLSSGVVIWLVNRALAKAVQHDRVTGRDDLSVETTDRFVAGGITAVVGGPALAGVACFAGSYAAAVAATLLAIFPVALGIDAIRTGLARRKARRRPWLGPKFP